MENQDSKDKALNPTVVKLGVVSFFTDVASEMLYPITPIFLTSILGASMASLGLIEGIAEATASLLKVYSGSWSDQIAKLDTSFECEITRSCRKGYSLSSARCVDCRFS